MEGLEGLRTLAEVVSQPPMLNSIKTSNPSKLLLKEVKTRRVTDTYERNETIYLVYTLAAQIG